MTKIPISENRRLEIKEIVYEALVHGGSSNIPIEIKKISKSYDNIRVIPFSVQMERRNMTLEEVYAQCETEDACADYYANVNKYIIYYNDVVKWKYIDSNRYRWSIAHELGHILLEHHVKYKKTRIFRSELSKSEYDYLEAEADYFAQLILVPHAALWEHGNVSRVLIYNLCKISWPASWNRYDEYKKWYKNIGKDDYDRRIHNFFFSFLNTKTCMTCNATLVQKKEATAQSVAQKTL